MRPPFEILAVGDPLPTRSELLAAALNGFVAWGLSFFGALAAMEFAAVAANPWAALYGAGMPAAVVFFSQLRALQRGQTASDPPADTKRGG